jgi:hypothetical protein
MFINYLLHNFSYTAYKGYGSVIRGQGGISLFEYGNYRKQKVVIRDSSSSLSNVSAGVPQGSVLGPLLFLIYMYINDIGEQLLSLTRLFADDTSLGYSSSNPDTLELVINHVGFVYSF